MSLSYDIIGSIAIVKPGKLSGKELKKEAKQLLKQKNIKTILLKTSKFQGRLRKIKTKFLAGIKTKETIYRENSCLFKLDIDKTYFSPRLSNERLEIANMLKKQKKKNILVMFAGIAPFSIIISKFNPQANICSIELNKIASKYAIENVKLNRLKNIKTIQGDVKKIKQIIKKQKLPEKYDAIIMPRAQLPCTFLKEAFSVAGKNCLIIFYDFLKQDEFPDKSLKAIQEEAKKSKRKIKVLNYKRGIEIAPYKFRSRFDFKIL